MGGAATLALGSVRIKPAAAGEQLGKTWFLADLARCEGYLAEQGLRAACDLSVDAIIVSRIIQSKHLPEIANHITVLQRVPMMSSAELSRVVHEHRDVVWVSAAAPPVQLPLLQEPARSVLTDGRLVGIARASPFNAGYAGLSLHAWRGKEPGPPIVWFYGGKERERDASG